MQLLHWLRHDVLKGNVLVTDSLQQQQQHVQESSRQKLISCCRCCSVQNAVSDCEMLAATWSCWWAECRQYPRDHAGEERLCSSNQQRPSGPTLAKHGRLFVTWQGCCLSKTSTALLVQNSSTADR